VSFERVGIPAIVICSDIFEPLAHSVTGALGVSKPRLVVVPHPIGGFSPADLRDKGLPDQAIRAVDQLIATSGREDKR
jgi:hypothetical protein